MVNAPVIQFQNVSKKFGNHVVLRNVNFNILYRDVYGIIGVSGSGKTTILNILVGFYRADNGRILFQSRKIQNQKKAIEELFGFATQSGSYYDKLTVKENLQYFGRLYNLSKGEVEKRAKVLLELVELEEAEDVLAEDLSTGMKRRLDIACAMVHDPKVLILDEPTEDLDPVLRKEILGLIKRISYQGTTIIITSHLLSEMEEVCNRISILHLGKILKTGTPDQIKDSYSKNEEIHLTTYPGNYGRIIRGLSKRYVKKAIEKRNKLIIYTDEAEKMLSEILKVIKRSRERLVDVDVNKPSLEEVFESLTRRK